MKLLLLNLIVKTGALFADHYHCSSFFVSINVQNAGNVFSYFQYRNI